MDENQYETDERIVHKLLGAAYQMTFDGEYDMAIQTAISAVTYWRKVNDGVIGQDEASVLYPPDEPSENQAEATTDGGTQAQSTGLDTLFTDDYPDIGVGPSEGTKSREAVIALAEAMRHQEDWVAPKEVRQRTGTNEEIVMYLPNLSNEYEELIQSRDNQSGVGNEYKIHQQYYNQFR